MYSLTIEFSTQAGAHTHTASFGIRTASSYVDKNGHRVYQ